MKDNYIGNLLIAGSIGILIFFAGARACESYPFLAKWMGGSCWLEKTSDTETEPLNAGEVFLHAQALHAGRSDDDVTKAAIYALAQSGSAKAVETLKELVRTHPSIEIKKAALHALAQCSGSADLLAFYKEIAENGEELELRKAAIYGLGQIGDQPAIDILLELATSVHHVSVRKAAVHALQNCESEPAQQALYQVLARVSDSL